MNDFTKKEPLGICPLCEKELIPELIEIESLPTKCLCCYECGIISAPFYLYKYKVSHE